MCPYWPQSWFLPQDEVPQLEEYHWEHVVADFEDKSIENEFYRIMLAGLSVEHDDKEN